MAALIRNADVAADAGIDSAKLAAWSMNRSAGGFKLTNLAAGVAPGDAVNKAQLDAVAAGTSAVWGAITGTLSNQTDLQAALDAKQAADGTTVGLSFFHLGNPGAITFPRINADNSVSALNASDFRTAIGAGTGSGTVTAVSIATANGVSGSSSGGATPALTIVLGAITPSSIAATGTITGTNLSGTNTGDQTITLTGEVTGSGTGSFAATITAAAVTYAKIQNVAALSVFGRSANTSGVGADITGSNGQILRVSGTSLGFGSIVPASIAMGTGKLLGRSATSAAEEITVGTGLSLSAGTLTASIAWGTITGTITDQTDLVSLITGMIVDAGPPFIDTQNLVTNGDSYTRFDLSILTPGREVELKVQDIGLQTIASWQGFNVFEVTQTINTGANGTDGVIGLELANTNPANIGQPEDAPWILFAAHGNDGLDDHLWEMNERFTVVNGTRAKFAWEFSENEDAYVETVSIDSAGSIYGTGYLNIRNGVISGVPGTTGLLTEEGLIFYGTFGGSISSTVVNSGGPLKFNTPNTTAVGFRFSGASTLTSGHLIEGWVANSGFTGSYIRLGKTSSGTAITTLHFEITSAGGVNVAGKIAPITDDGAALGDTTHNFSDLFLATGAVINFANSNYTATHSSGKLTFTGTTATGTIDVITSSNSNSISMASMLAASGTGDIYLSVGKALSASNAALIGWSNVGSTNPYCTLVPYGLAASTFAVNNTGRIGMGIAEPLYQLHIKSTASTSGGRFAVESNIGSVGNYNEWINFVSGASAIYTSFRHYIHASGAGAIALCCWDGSAANEKFRVTGDANAGLGVSAWGTSAAKVLGIGNGTEPTTSPADMVQLYSVDLSAGNATLGIRTETAVVTESVVSDRTLSVRINGTTYKICLKV